MTAGTIEVAAAREAGGGLGDEIRAVRVVWLRELLRLWRTRARFIGGLAQPILFLFIMGTGLSPLFRGSQNSDFDFRTFMFPGILAMSILFTALFSSISIVWDREFGFLREMLVAPVRQGSILIGKCLGGTTIATAQGAVMLAFAGVVGIPYSPLLLVVLLLEMALAAFAISALGLMIAARIREMEGFQVVMQFLTMPMFFLSGALFPLSGLPAWLSWLTKVDPLTYAVDPMRRAVFSEVGPPAEVSNTLNPGVFWGSWQVPVLFELGLVAAFALVALSIAMLTFQRSD